MKKLLKNRYFYVSLAAVFTLIFLAQNNKPVSIDFFFWELASANLLALLTIFFFLGAASGIFAYQIYRYRSGRKERGFRTNKSGVKRQSSGQSKAYENLGTDQVKTPLH